MPPAGAAQGGFAFCLVTDPAPPPRHAEQKVLLRGDGNRTGTERRRRLDAGGAGGTPFPCPVSLPAAVRRAAEAGIARPRSPGNRRVRAGRRARAPPTRTPPPPRARPLRGAGGGGAGLGGGAAMVALPGSPPATPARPGHVVPALQLREDPVAAGAGA